MSTYRIYHFKFSVSPENEQNTAALGYGRNVNFSSSLSDI